MPPSFLHPTAESKNEFKNLDDPHLEDTIFVWYNFLEKFGRCLFETEGKLKIKFKKENF